MKIRIPFLLVLSLLSAFFFSQERGFQVVAKTKEGEIIELYRGCYALVIGVSDYLSGWPDLPNAGRDADDVGDLLSSLGFNVTRVKNPTKAQLIQAFDTFVFGPGQHEDNCLVIFFAGHGHTERLAYGNDLGYIVPKDSPSPGRDKPGFMQNAVDMRTIEAYARRIQAKHALFLFDSCFSGAIFDMVRAITEDIRYKTGKPVRQFITAGEADEPVPDRSIFKSQLMEGLRGEADRNSDGYVTGTELGEFLQEKVVNYSYGSQHPQYGKIRDPNLDKGDFVFVVGSKPEKAEKPIGTEKPEIALEPRYGSLEVYVDIPGAKVYLDGRYQDTTEEGYAVIIKKLLVGRHSIRIAHEKYKDYETQVNIYEDKREKLTPMLEPIGPSIQERPTGLELPSGYLLISSHPPSEVEIDGKLYGIVPPLLEVKIPEGKHTIRFIHLETKKEKTVEVELSKGETKRIHEKLD